MTTTLWELQNLTVADRRDKRLDDLSLHVRSGVTAVVGYSGAGKTTLLNVLAGMNIKRDTGAAVTGSVKFTGTGDSARLPLFWVPQDAGLWAHMTVEQHLTTVLPADTDWTWISPHKPLEAANGLRKLLEEFDLHRHHNVLPGTLSQGEQARLAVARCLAAQPAVMLMDEPLGQTDPVRRPHYWSLIRQYISHSRASLIFTSHTPEQAIGEAEHIICLNRGRLVCAGRTMDVYNNPPSHEAALFLGPVNWFDSGDAERWLADKNDVNGAVRPERMLVVPDADGMAVIESSRFHGSYAETVVTHTTTDLRRTIYHRPPHGQFNTGQRVRVEVL